MSKGKQAAPPDPKPTPEQGELISPNPERYREMCVPFESREAASDAVEGFIRDVYAARVKHKIPDVYIIVRATCLDSSGEEVALGTTGSLGSSEHRLPMVAGAFGAEQEKHAEMVASIVRAGRKGK